MSFGGMPSISSSTRGWKAYMPGIRQVGDRPARLLHEARDPARGVEFYDSPGRRPFRMKHRHRRNRVLFPVSVHERTDIEIREVVGVARQEVLLPTDPVPVGDEGARATE